MTLRFREEKLLPPTGKSVHYTLKIYNSKDILLERKLVE